MKKRIRKFYFMFLKTAKQEYDRLKKLGYEVFFKEKADEFVVEVVENDK